MLKVVSNTSPIISLLKLSQLDILRLLYGTITIPMAVYSEIEAGKHKTYYHDLSKLDWINILAVENRKLVNDFDLLDSGEAEAITLSLEMNADLLLIDEKLGRFYAKEAGLKISGTLGILVKAKEKGYVKKLSPIISELREKDVWLSDNLVYKVLISVNEV